MAIQCSEGSTPSEKYLKRLCDHAFLSLWSYPSVYRDQGKGEKGEGKELCDLLVVFENHIIIFSDKYIKFPKSGNIQLDWSRWFKRAVYESAKQIWGAERWLKSFPNRLFLDRGCTQPFPIELPSPSKARFHRLVITHDVAKNCRHYFRGGSGSLFLDNTIIGDSHFMGECQPFEIGQIDPSKGYIHILDDVTLEIILGKLDTITDFVDYLSRKEKFLSSNISVFAAGEEELLAYYFQQLDKDGKHDFILPKEKLGWLSLEEGFWEDFLQSPQFKAQLEADQISYSWDALIETFTKHILDDTQHYANPPGPRNQEKIVRFLAREPRIRRRMLAKSLIDLLKNTKLDKSATRVVLPSKEGEPYYVFLLFPHYENQSIEDYREMRREVLYSYCLVTKLKFLDAKDIVGVATDSGMDSYRSEDLVYLDGREWTEDEKKDAEYFSNEIGLLKTLKKYASKEYEFPVKNSRKRKRRHSKKK